MGHVRRIRVRISAEAEIVFSPSSPGRLQKPPSLLFNRYCLRAEDKNTWSFTATPPYLFMAWCLIRKKRTLSLPFVVLWKGLDCFNGIFRANPIKFVNMLWWQSDDHVLRNRRKFSFPLSTYVVDLTVLQRYYYPYRTNNVGPIR
jgi:hypothetical protein